MKHLIILMCLLGTDMVMAQSGSMQLNFGASNARVRTNAGYAHNPAASKGEYGRLGNSEAGMLSNFRGNTQIMVMVNNNNILACDQMMRPKFITGGVGYDDLLKRQTFSLGYGQSTQFFLPASVVAIKGMWSSNLVLMEENRKYKKGVNFSFTGYTKKYGIEISSTFAGSFINTAIVHRKVAGNLMIAGGIEQNFPKAALEYMVKFVRVSVYGTRMYDRVIPGFTTTINL